jgi:DNA-binding beta-propeller fold protein YncE
MKHLASAALFATSLAIGSPRAGAIDLGPRWIDVEPFATLPQGVRYPEGITANPATGDVYVATFDFGPNTNKLMRFGRNGHLEATRDFGGAPMLGLGFADGKVYILNMGASQVQRIAADFDASTPIEEVAAVPLVGAPVPRSVPNPDGSSDTIVFATSTPPFPAPNAMVFDHLGNLYVSDSFQGAIFRIASATTCATPCAATTLAQDSLLATAGFPPFGANGLAFDADEANLFVANTGDDRVLKMNMASGEIAVFAESINGADGLLRGPDGRLWVAANQADEVVALNDNGRIVVRAGTFEGIRKDGTPRGLLFPASMVAVDGWMYVTNLALPLTPAVGDEPEEDVTRWNVVRFRLPRH